jgi:hypothetical protein
MRARWFLVSLGLMLAALGSTMMLVVTGFDSSWIMVTFLCSLGTVITFALGYSSP